MSLHKDPFAILVLNCAKEFMDTFNPDGVNVDLLLDLLAEERQELDAALREEDLECQLKEACDVQYVWGQVVILMMEDESVIEQPEAPFDVQRSIEAFLQSVPFNSLDVAEAFRRVHESNMSKLGEDGQVKRRKSDGKVLKGPNYQPPVLTDIVERALRIQHRHQTLQ